MKNQKIKQPNLTERVSNDDEINRDCVEVIVYARRCPIRSSQLVSYARAMQSGFYQNSKKLNRQYNQ
ncbi:MAG: hypothetical protein AABX16_00850 [Nanoarchaeota archaeon]